MAEFEELLAEPAALTKDEEEVAAIKESSEEELPSSPPPEAAGSIRKRRRETSVDDGDTHDSPQELNEAPKKKKKKTVSFTITSPPTPPPPPPKRGNQSTHTNGHRPIPMSYIWGSLLFLFLMAVMIRMNPLSHGSDTQYDSSPFLKDTMLADAEHGQLLSALVETPQRGVERNVREFMIQYRRMREVCERIRARSHWKSVNDGSTPLNIHEPALRELSGQPNSPFFCVNTLLDQVASEASLSLREQRLLRQQKVDELRKARPKDGFDIVNQMLDAVSIYRGYSAVNAAFTPYDDMGTTPNIQMGYLDDTMIVRDLLALRNDEAVLMLVDYADLIDFTKALHADQDLHYTDSVCLCGLHLMMPRSIVVSRSESRTVLLMEPKIKHFSGTDLYLTPSEFPWERANANSRFHAYQHVSDQAFRTIMDDAAEKTPFHFYSDVTVQSMTLSSSSGESTPYMNDKRSLHQLHGDSAMCVQYCALLAGDLVDYADSHPPNGNEKLVL